MLRMLIGKRKTDNNRIEIASDTNEFRVAASPSSSLKRCYEASMSVMEQSVTMITPITGIWGFRRYERLT